MRLPNWSYTVIIYAAIVVPPTAMYLWPRVVVPIWMSGVLVSILLGVGRVLWDWRLDPRRDPELGSGCFSLVFGSFLFSWIMVWVMVTGWFEDRRLKRAKESTKEDGTRRDS